MTQLSTAMKVATVTLDGDAHYFASLDGGESYIGTNYPAQVGDEEQVAVMIKGEGRETRPVLVTESWLRGYAAQFGGTFVVSEVER